MQRTFLLAFLSLAFVVLIAPAVRCDEPDTPASIPTPKFERQVIDANIQIGYGIAIGDVDGDGKPDILLADKRQIVWYRNGDWKRFVMAENLTPQDNVCIAARDIDGSGKVSVAVGAGWNPGETNDPSKSGAVFYLIRPDDPTKRWEPVELHHEVTVHRMQWVKTGPRKADFQLVVLPLHGQGNKDGKGNGVRIIAYEKPNDPHAKWITHKIDSSMHMAHNFDLVWNEHGDCETALVAGKEGIGGFADILGQWKDTGLYPEVALRAGAGEVRLFNRELVHQGIATIEPMHGNQVVFYIEPHNSDEVTRKVLDESLSEGHGLACADLLGTNREQIVAGWRMPNKDKKVGIKMYIPLDNAGQKWTTEWIDDNGMACEDLKIADLDGDGRPDIIASGRATHNLVVYWNRTKFPADATPAAKK